MSRKEADLDDEAGEGLAGLLVGIGASEDEHPVRVTSYVPNINNNDLIFEEKS